MFNLTGSFILLLCVAITKENFLRSISQKSEAKHVNFYKDILTEIKKQRNYEGLLIFHHKPIKDLRLQTIFTLQTPKIIVTQYNGFHYKENFDSDVVAVVIMENKFDYELWQAFIQTLNLMRQIRILMIFVNIFNNEVFQRIFLHACELSKITNAISHFINTTNLQEPSREFLLLAPYPNYHFVVKEFETERKYFLPEKLDMKGKAITTLADQNIPRSIVFKDENGRIKFSGFAYRMVETFARLHNATYKLLYQPKLDEVIHLSILANMTKHGVLDIPMSVSPMHNTDKLRYLSYPVETSKWIIMVPCAKPMAINEVYKVLFTIGLILAFSVFCAAFSLIHTIIEKLFYKRMIWLNLLMSDKVIPGLLGQSFAPKKTKLLSLRWVYILIFVMGLFMSTTISAHLQTLLTSPPFYRQIKTFDDLHQSGLKILFDALDSGYLEKDDFIFKEKMSGCIEYTNDTTLFNKYRKNFNTTYAYPVTWALWNVFTYIQKAYVQKEFCVNDNLNIRDILLLAIPLEYNSPYRMPMDELIHKVHNSGLLNIWQLQNIGDLLKLKKISFHDSSRMKVYDDLTEKDLFYVWMILVFGLMSSLLVFFVELLFDLAAKKFQRKH